MVTPDLVQLLIENGWLHRERACPKFGEHVIIMNASKISDGVTFRCRRTSSSTRTSGSKKKQKKTRCDEFVSVRKDSSFQNSNVCIKECIWKGERIGGEGKIVELDESKFSRRKYHQATTSRVNGFLAAWSEEQEGVSSFPSRRGIQRRYSASFESGENPEEDTDDDSSSTDL
ncbi:unnamed protein product [Darwinula stevensoni]|uniref:Uncharacterized protein n=1 Tax=Darwinula stevensoni TaxID=69355 RepID=A0A7R9AGS8_9CRUS|nr:unnamed protein product [Darwinula stevensoni]CAG0904510.1 unnamed protein product [Darwinula stevensoni]